MIFGRHSNRYILNTQEILVAIITAKSIVSMWFYLLSPITQQHSSQHATHHSTQSSALSYKEDP